jgi:hypothetical protein
MGMLATSLDVTYFKERRFGLVHNAVGHGDQAATSQDVTNLKQRGIGLFYNAVEDVVMRHPWSPTHEDRPEAEAGKHVEVVALV